MQCKINKNLRPMASVGMFPLPKMSHKKMKVLLWLISPWARLIHEILMSSVHPSLLFISEHNTVVKPEDDEMDETKLNLFCLNKKYYGWRNQNQKTVQHNNFIPLVKPGGGRIIVWVYFTAFGPGKLGRAQVILPKNG